MNISLKAAHQLAKSFIGDYRACLTLAMIQLWAEAKAPKKVAAKSYAYILAVKETEKAIAAYVPSGYGESLVWFPKSQLEDMTNSAFGVPRWLWSNKGGSSKFRDCLPFDWKAA